jgi:hypothetical protein
MQKKVLLSLRFLVKKSATFTTILRVKKSHFHYDMQKRFFSSSEFTSDIFVTSPMTNIRATLDSKIYFAFITPVISLESDNLDYICLF